MMDLTMTEQAQRELDSEFLHFLEQHAIINNCAYDFKSEEDKAVFYLKYTETLNSIRAKFGLSPIELSKSTLERIDLGEKPKVKRTRKPKQAPVQAVNEPVVYDVDINRDTLNPVVVGETVLPYNVEIEKIMNELNKANKILNKIINIVNAVKR